MCLAELTVDNYIISTSASKVNQSSLPSWPVMIPDLRIQQSVKTRAIKVQNCSPASDEAEDARCELIGAVHLHRHDRLKQLPDPVLGHLSKGGLGGLVECPLGRVNLVKLA